MKTTKIFINGQSQFVCLPKEFRFDDSDVYITKLDNLVILCPKKDIWATFLSSLDQFSDDFMVSRNQPSQQQREEIE